MNLKSDSSPRTGAYIYIYGCFRSISKESPSLAIISSKIRNSNSFEASYFQDGIFLDIAHTRCSNTVLTYSSYSHQLLGYSHIKETDFKH